MPLEKLDLIKEQSKELPNNIEAEQSVIGSILVSNEIFDEVSPIIDSSKFHDPVHPPRMDGGQSEASDPECLSHRSPFTAVLID